MFDLFIRFRVSQAGRPKTENTRRPSIDKRAENPLPQRRLLTIKEIPAWVDANPFILSGYRPASNSARVSLASWTYLHNESCNIYSHLIPAMGALLAQGFLYHHVSTKYENLTSFDWSILSLQLLSALICLTTSTLYHTLLNHSAQVAHRWLLNDYVGIITLILGNFISGLHFGFYCSEHMKLAYWTLILVVGSTTGMILVSPKFQGPEWRVFRLRSFICTGMSAFAPIGHATLRWGPGFVARIGVPYYLGEGLLILIGCYFWERRVPERYYPGRFDIFGHSHTIWHIFVVLAIAVHVMGLLSAMDYDYNESVCRP